ncbi:hypothetical protein Gohar_018335 [Gossypium harknessii]|uniref:Uncharacterized protein n=1 Tax=Gossypium harknessii TaxID=34285 RepID=A0A7J9G902_9ROSI|nr:hypothetical protein [Gossypium harknessii]
MMGDFAILDKEFLEEIKDRVKKVMERREGKKMKEKTLEWKKKAEEATDVEGLSYCNFDKFVNEAFKHG